jgi:hypothetical protein
LSYKVKIFEKKKMVPRKEIMKLRTNNIVYIMSAQCVSVFYEIHSLISKIFHTGYDYICIWNRTSDDV